jgi:heme/copper-type cytochrome/quinol oxidase subunit 2
MKNLIAVFLLLIMLAACNTPTEQMATDKIGELREFEITAKNWEFSPNVITVNLGDMVRLKITGLDDGIGSHHSLAIPEFGINVPVRKGEVAVAEFTANKIGTFAFVCSVYCGEDHGSMRGTLIVNG